ncbi:hypothetical protein ABPG75_009532 [Micractinium tetrahymenae]
MLLAKQGFKVDVFERLPPLVDDEGNAQASIGPRSYNILLSERAVAAMEAAGAEVSGFDVPNLRASLRHKLRGGPKEGTPSMPPGRSKVANRGVLAGALVQQCLAQHADRVQFHFEQELAAIDISNSAVYFKPVGSAAQGAAMASATAGAGGGCSGCASGEEGGGLGPVAVGRGGVAAAPPEALTQRRTPASADALASYTFDLLVGADGANSTTRAVLQRYDPGLACRLKRDGMEFKTCVLGPAADFMPADKGGVGTFQTWSNAKLQATLVGLSTDDGQLRCAFILPGGVHATLRTAADYEAYLADAIPSLPKEAVQRAAPQLADCPISNGGTIVRCTKLNSHRAVLVGDAAHSVYPTLGQGANAALEGAAMLAATLQEVGTDDMEAAAAEYSRRWLPNALAVADLTEEGFGGNKRAYALNLKLLQLISQMLLHKLLPFLVPKPAFFQLNTTRMPFAVILQRGKQELLVFKCILAAVVAALAAALWRSVGRAALAAVGLA